MDLYQYEGEDLCLILNLLELCKVLLQYDILTLLSQIRELSYFVITLLNKIFRENSKPSLSSQSRLYYLECKLKLIDLYHILIEFDVDDLTNTILRSI